MNGLVPVLIAVLLAEFGPRAALYAEARWRAPAPWLIAASVIGAAIAGGWIAPSLTEWADAFLIAIALAFGALGQAQRVKPATGTISLVMGFWHGAVPLIAFAFAARFGTTAAAFGALFGLLAAAIVTRTSGSRPVTLIRWGAVTILGIAAAVVAIGALRLV